MKRINISLFAMALLRNLTVLIKPVFVSGLLLFGLNAAALNLYKWVGPDGKITYQDQPPPLGQKFEEKSISDGGANTNKSPEVLRAKAVRENPVVLYYASNCDSCDLIRSILEKKQIPFTSKNAENDAGIQKELIDLAGAIRVPSLTIGKELINGYKRNAIEDALRKGGYPPATADDSQ